MLPLANLLILGLLLPVQAAPAAAAEPRLTVFVAHAGDDAVGKALAAQVASAIERSTVSTPAPNRDDAQVVLFLTTLNPDAARPGVLTTAAWSLVYVKEAMKVYVGSGLRLTDQARLARTGDEIVATVDQLLRGRRAELPGSADWKAYATAWQDEADRVAETLPEDACGINVRNSFLEQMRALLRWSQASNQRFDVREIAKTVMADYTTEDEFQKRLQGQGAKLAQCQADLAALRKPKK